jgi:hypothetical protein
MVLGRQSITKHYVRLEVFTAVTVKIGVFWDVTRRNIPEDTILQ